jgi:hypothetical protein
LGIVGGAAGAATLKPIVTAASNNALQALLVIDRVNKLTRSNNGGKYIGNF